MGSRTLNLERGIFAAVLLLCGWQAYAYVFQAPQPAEMGEPSAPRADPAGNLAPLAEPLAAASVLGQGRDPLVPLVLTAISEKKVSAVVATKDPPKNVPEKAPPKHTTSVTPPRDIEDIPSPPAATTEAPERVTPKELENDPYRLPVAVHGFMEASATNPMKVIVSPADGGDMFTLAVGDRWADIRVRSITPDSVEFETPDGRIVYVDRDSLGAAPGGGAGERLSLFGQSMDPDKFLPDGVEGAPDIAAVLKAIRKMPNGSALREAIEQGDISKVKDFVQDLSPEERERLLKMVRTLKR